MDQIDRIRELAPSSGGAGHRGLREELRSLGDVGILAISTVSGHSLGEIDLGQGDRRARLLVMEDGLSMGSGCEVFTPLLLIYQEGVEQTGQQG